MTASPYLGSASSGISDAKVKRAGSLPETRYGFDVYPWWNNLNDKVAYERMFAEGLPQKMRIAQAMISQNPLTPNDEIRQNMTVRGTTPKQGYPISELTISQVLNQEYPGPQDRVNTTLWNDFSDSNGETNATERPGIFF